MSARAAPVGVEIADRLAPSRNYWLGTCDPERGSARSAGAEGARAFGTTVYLYTARGTVKARHVAANPEVVVHLESAEDVVIVNGTVEDLGPNRRGTRTSWLRWGRSTPIPLTSATCPRRIRRSICCGG